ncbi:hypothetical protein [Candidatus Curculioniphilus buchneri]|uniref:hypothetical protein n=1 Tax=Candidatus Curculioniphilus buchneri TaxID=690594 RepID=UPI00376F3D98
MTRKVDKICALSCWLSLECQHKKISYKNNLTFIVIVSIVHVNRIKNELLMLSKISI